MTPNDAAGARVPDACTLPVVEQPLRLAEFDSLFAGALRGQRRMAATRLRWMLDPGAEAFARDLTDRETRCCSFFTFAFAPAGDDLLLDVEVPQSQVSVLDALETWAASARSGGNG
jgi:hypothetical protein